MNVITRTLSAALLLAVLTSCSSGDDDSSGSHPPAPDPAPQTSQSSPADPTSSAPGSDANVVSVTLVRSGGLKPIKVARTFADEQPPPKGYTQADVDAVLRLANAFSAADVELTPLPPHPCCDLYTYNVTLTRADGTSEQLSTVDGVEQPPAFDKLLSALA